MAEADVRKRICDAAREWIGTPFRNNAMVRGVGCDCAGFLAGCYIDAGVLPKDFAIGKYNPQHSITSYEEKYVEYLLQYLTEVPEGEARSGDCVLYKSERTYAHSGVILQWPEQIVHAVRAAGVGVTISHGTRDALVQGRARRFFSIKGKV